MVTPFYKNQALLPVYFYPREVLSRNAKSLQDGFRRPRWAKSAAARQPRRTEISIVAAELMVAIQVFSGGLAVGSKGFVEEVPRERLERGSLPLTEALFTLRDLRSV